jgi:hypothetical protein
LGSKSTRAHDALANTTYGRITTFRQTMPILAQLDIDVNQNHARLCDPEDFTTDFSACQRKMPSPCLPKGKGASVRKSASSATLLNPWAVMVYPIGIKWDAKIQL